MYAGVCIYPVVVRFQIMQASCVDCQIVTEELSRKITAMYMCLFAYGIRYLEAHIR